MQSDLNNDGTVDSFDLSILLANWGTADPTADINTDGNVDVFDLSILLSEWGNPALPTSSSGIWRYYDAGNEPANDGSANTWKQVDYDDSEWSYGPAEMGYGDGDESTVLASGINTAYFRKKIKVSSASAVTHLRARLIRDDGAIVYINNTEVIRSNMPADPITYSTFASGTVGEPGESTWFEFAITPSMLVDGTNVISTEVHQGSGSSPDLSFNLTLDGLPLTPNNLSATALDGQVDLNWNLATGADTYTVYRSTTSGSGYSEIQANVATNSYSDITVTNGTTYYYVVTAVNPTGETGNSNEANGTPAASGGAGLPLVSGAAWKYYDAGDEPANDGSANNWRQIAYDDSGWSNGQSELGYGDGDEATVTASVNAVYFRMEFDVPTATNVTHLRARLIRDDGAIVNINNTEVIRSNMPADPITYATFASSTVGLPGESTWYEFAITPTMLVDGNNIISAEVHQGSGSSPDLSFNITLDELALTPTNLSALPSDGQVDLSWDAATGADTYTVYRSTTSGSGYTEVQANVATNSFSDTTVTNGTTYYYLVTAVNAAGETGYSIQSNATPSSGILSFMWSGAVTSDSLRVTAKAASDSSMRLVYSTSSDLSSPSYSSMVNVDSSTDFTGHLDISGLDPSTTYHYAVEVNSVLDASRGQAQTFPTSGVATSFTFAASGCAQTGSTSTVFNSIVSQSPKFFQILGDLFYDDPINTAAEYRARYDSVQGSSTQSNLHHNMPVNYVWDDHDFGDNNGDGTWAGKTNAATVYRERFPHYSLPAGTGTNPIYHKYQYGRVVFLVTDLRYNRSPSTDPDDVNKTMMGATQKQWFKDGLTAIAADSNIKLVVWVCSVPWIAGQSAGADHWGGFSTERQELADHIASLNLQTRMMVLAGDAHMLAIDNGTNSDYSTGVAGGFPVFQCAPLSQSTSTKGGPYSEGTVTTNGQYGLITITDTGGSGVDVVLSGRNISGSEVITLNFSTSVSGSSPLYPSTTLHPSNTLYPS